MCHYNYWGYDGCSHELRHMDNRWTLCPLSDQMAPRDCPFAAYTRHKIGIAFCESCLDEVPPNHVPVTRIILDFDSLRQAMELSVDRAALTRFIRDYRAGLRRVRETAFVSGPNNNFYNEIWALYHNFHQRAINEMSVSWAAFDDPPAGIEGASTGLTGLGITSPESSSTSPGYYSISPGFDSTTAGTSYTMASIDSTIMAAVDSTSAGVEGASSGSDSNATGSENNPYGVDTPSPGASTTSSGFDSTSSAV
ncbi:hypothetical protein FHL15_006432 [Xylaria flabelliformis]|uniref:Uncharacterized protein n=1 Tax=Xylaria flabelliformis TaxID=2512241 RepID=A0A553HXT2_9PEZI|nr:hypothetical protein FHL15_006432 [Xylaria flabelliformis]